MVRDRLRDKAFIALSSLALLLIDLCFEDEACDEPRELAEQTDAAAEDAKVSAFDAVVAPAPCVVLDNDMLGSVRTAEGRIRPGIVLVVLSLVPVPVLFTLTFTFMLVGCFGPDWFCSMYAVPVPVVAGGAKCRKECSGAMDGAELIAVNAAGECKGNSKGSEKTLLLLLMLLLLLLLPSFPPNQLQLALLLQLPAIVLRPVIPKRIPCPWRGEVFEDVFIDKFIEAFDDEFASSAAAVVASSMASLARSASSDSIN